MGSLLLSKGARVDEKDNAGQTSLHYAASYAIYGDVDCPSGFGSVEFGSLLHGKGARVDEKDNDGSTPLRALCSFSRPCGDGLPSSQQGVACGRER